MRQLSQLMMGIYNAAHLQLVLHKRKGSRSRMVVGYERGKWLKSVYHLERADKFVYHYTKAEPLADRILPNGNIRFSRFTTTNDPRECKDWGLNFHTSGNFDDLTHRQWELLQIEASNLLKNCCRLFCTTADDASAVGMGIDKIYGRGFCRARMWNQYAMKQTGACLIFDRASLDAQLRNMVPSGVQVHYGPVIYKNRSQVPLVMGDAFTLNYDAVRAVGLMRAVQLHLARYHRELFFEKATDWADEREVRWLLHLVDDHDLDVPIADSVVGIVITPDFPAEHRHELEKYADAHPIDIGELRWKNGTPEIVPSPLACVRVGP
jgi:hypothetical protein